MTPLVQRSDLRRAARLPDRRKRDHLRRYVWAAIMSGLVAAFVWAVRSRALADNAFGRVVYGIHDQIWLPIYGTLWLKHAPFSLIWVAPAAIISLLVVLEWLGLSGAIRMAQTRMLRWLLYRRLGRAVIWLFSFVPLTGRARLALLVLDAEIDGIASRIKSGAGQSPDFRNLARLAPFRTRLARSAPDALRDAEIAILIRRAHPDPKAANRLLRRWAGDIARALTDRFADPPADGLCRILCDTWLADNADGTGPDATKPILRHAARLRHSAQPAPDLTDLAILTAISAAGQPQARALVAAILQHGVRHIWTGPANTTTRTQTSSIDQAYWLAQIEAMTTPLPEMTGDIGAGRPRDMGEIFARTGARP